MARALKVVLLLAIVGGAAFAFLRWPRLETVETGRTPEYPELRPRDYPASEEAVTRAARAAIDRLSGWTFVGSGRGPGGTEIQAQAQTPVVPVKHDVAVRIRREGARTRVTVLSRSRTGQWDFGQNARLIQAFYAELDRQVAAR